MSPRLVIAVLVALAACRDSAPEKAHIGPPPPPPPVVTQAAPDPWTAATNARKDPLPHPLFWKLEKDGKTTYLLGTMHIGIDPTSRLLM